MMTNLFSIFDPSSSIFSMSLNWVALLATLIVMPPSYWVLNCPTVLMMRNLSKGLLSEMKPLLKIYFPSVIFCIALFYFIMLNNVAGLLPFVYTPTSHLSITLPLALTLWLGYYMYSWVKNTISTLSHLVPQGTPVFLMPLMVMIETISGLIRPVTLSVRLMANMVAGHLLLALAGGAVNIMAFSSVATITGVQVIMMVLEIAVACIQAYVFSVLTTLYVSEV